MAGTGSVGAKRAVLGLEDAVEQHRLDPDVVVEVLQVAQPRDPAQGVRRELRRAVAGEVDGVTRSQPAGLEQSGDPTAPRDVGLQAVHRIDDVAEVRRHERVLACCDVQPARSRIPV